MPRTLAIGDVHGCDVALKALVKAIELQADDTLVMLGDYVDRGPGSRQVIEQLLELAGHCRLVPLLGNHDAMLLAAHDDSSALTSWLQMGGGPTLESYGTPGSLDGVPPEHFVFLRQCLKYFETETHFFVHACYDPRLPLEQQTEWTQLWVSLRDYVPGPHRSGKTAIVGHTRQPTNEILDLGYLKCLDTGCYKGGWLTALDVTTGRVWQVDRNGQRRG